MLHRQIQSQFQEKRRILFVATVHEISHGRDITWTLRAKPGPELIAQAWIGTSWIVEVAASGTRAGKPFKATHLFLSSLRTTPIALLQLVRDRWSNCFAEAGDYEGWHWIRDTSSMRMLTAIGVMASARWPRCARQLSTCSGWTGISADPGRNPGGDARHPGAAGNGQATAEA